MTELTLTKAEENHTSIVQLIKGLKIHFLAVGDLLYESREQRYFEVTGESSFKDYVETLGIGSWSWVTRLIDLSQVVKKQLLNPEDLGEIGVGKASLLLPLIKRENIDDETMMIAKNGTTRDLRKHLGLKVNENDGEYSVVCPRCGFEILGAHYKPKRSCLNG